ncbi:MAG TPA: response regulator [Nitrososphaeraceae archaeon]|nr:response regulator [Nitrososphaeraceae archaeon]
MINNLDRKLLPRIMVVDDEKDILRIIKRDLESPLSTSEMTAPHNAGAQQDKGESEAGGDLYRKRVGDAFMVETFSNGRSALEALDSHPNDYYDLVVTDIRMPQMNGFELYRKIKERNPSMKIVFITAFEINKEEFNKVLPSIEVKDFIIKPISMTNLRIKLNEVLKGY